MESIDVVMLTMNSEGLLRECVESVYDNLPVSRLIVVDGLSTDRTLEILNDLSLKHGNIEVIAEKSSRAKARETGIRKVKTDWFMFVDSDVILCKDWFQKAKKQMAKDVGAVWGLNVDVVGNVKNRLFLKSLGFVAKEVFKLRGGMHDTLIRRELVENIRIPDRLHAYEDAYIVNWIRKKGYKTVIGDDVYCMHHRPLEDWKLKESLSLAALDIKCGLIYAHVYRYAFYYPFFIFYWILQVLGSAAGNRSLREGAPKMI